jgi:translocation and assembly module TamB
MSKIVKIILAIIAVLAIAYGIILKLVLPSYMTTVIPAVENVAANYINGKVNIGQISVSPGLDIKAGDISVTNIKGEEIATIPSLNIGINPLKGLMDKSALGAVGSITVNNPVLKLAMDKKDKWNFSGLIKPSQEKSTAFKGKVYINNGNLLVSTPYGNWEAGLTGKIDAADDPKYSFNTDLLLNNESISATGVINTDLEGTINVKTSSLTLDSFGALLAHYLPVEDMGGAVSDVDLSWENNGTVTMSGSGKLTNTSGRVVSNGYNVPLVLDGKVYFKGMNVQTEKLNALVNQQACLIKGGVDLTDTKNPKAEELTITFNKFNPKLAEASLPVEGAINGSVVVNGTQDDYNLNGQLSADTLAVAGYTLQNVQVPVATSDGKLLLQGAQADYGGGHIYALGEYDMKSKDAAVGLDANDVDLTDITGSQVGSVKVNGTMFLAGKAETDHLKLSSAGDFMTVTWQNMDFHNLEVDVDIDGNNITINNFSCYTGDQGILLGQGKFNEGQIDGKVRMVRLPIANFLPLAGQTGSGELSGEFKLSGTRDSLNVVGPFSLENGDINGFKVSEAHGFAGWENRVLTLRRVEINMKQGRHTIDGTVNMQGQEPVFDLSAQTDNVRIEPLWQFSGFSIPVTGNLSNTIKIFGPLSQLTVTGSVHAWDGSVNKFLVDDVKGDYSYDKGTLALHNFVINTLTTNIKVDGKMLPDGTLSFGLDAQNIHLARIPAISRYADVHGIVNFSGSITGTYKQPLFNGVLTSDNITINGEGFTGIACSVNSQGGIINKLAGTFQQKAGGDYSIDLTADANQHSLQGDIDVQGGNVKSLLNIAKEDLDIQGFLTGRIELDKNGPHSGVTIKGNIDKASVRGVEFNTAEFDVFSNMGYWKINNLKAVETGGGLLVAQGEINARKGVRTIDMELDTNGANAKLLTAFMTHPIDLEGKLDIAAQVKGSLDNPEGNFSLQVSPGVIETVPFDNLFGMVTLRNDMFKLEQVLIQKGQYKISAYGTFPQDLLRRIEDRRNRQAKMDLQLKLDNANLAILPSLSKVVESATGDIDGGIDITGTLEDYYVNGSIVVPQGNVKFKQVKTTLDNLKLNVDFGGKQINLKELSATTGKKGRIMAHGNFALTKEDEAPYLLDFSAKDVAIESTMFKGTINADAEVEQRRNRPQITSHIRLDDVLLDLISVPELGEGDSNLGFNITLELGPKIHMHNSRFYNIWLAGGLQILGSSRHPRVNGDIHATKGTITYLSTPFDIDHAELTWPRREFVPNVSFEADTRFRGYNIKAKANGPLSLDTLNISLTSDPPRSEKEIMRMLTLKTDSANSGNDAQGLLDAGLQMAFLSDIEDFVKQNLALDDFRIYSGSIRSGLGFDLDTLKANTASSEERTEYNVLFSKYIGKNVMVGYTTSFDQKYHSVFAEYNINRHISLNFSHNEKSENWYGIQYQKTF